MWGVVGFFARLASGGDRANKCDVWESVVPYRAAQRTPIEHAWFGLSIALYILGPFIYLRALITGPKRIHRVLGFVFSPAQIMRYYLFLLVGAGILIFILLQFGL